ncbi:MAG: DNA mismatch repair protein MutS, partial [Oscillospiraceae bacterium]|nr:DNA mismatch repair protein MutS [Oscillospiraceae bacterium]
MAELTPMMRQYLEIKEQNKDAILFFRLGDFYEMFNEDALTASRELDLTLTTRDRGKAAEDQTPMCGVPYHSSDGYIARLISKGYKVAICEQTEDPAAAKGLVKRDIIRTVTPGTVIDSACLDAQAGNFLCGVFLDERVAGVAFCDMTTGHTHVTAFEGAERTEHLKNELARFSPAEAILNDGAYGNAEVTELLRDKLGCMVERGKDRFELKAAENAVRVQFGEEEFASLPRGDTAAVLALGGLLSYLYETQKCDLSHINALEYYEQGRFMELDLSARRNLELTETIRGKEKRGSLLWVLDKTKTAMGARFLRGCIERPLRDVREINRRLGAVEALVGSTVAREEMILAMTGVSDMERLIGRIVYGSAGGRDMMSLYVSIERLGALREQLQQFGSGRLSELFAQLDPLEDIASVIRETLVDEPPFSVREGRFVREGFNAEVDRLREILSGGKGLLARIETEEKEKTGIRTLKIGYNKVFGYYIEVSNSFKDQVPESYIRKQTLVNGERYITQEL